jgi:hypothetical protein
VFTTEGGHDWPQWSQLWRKMLDVLPLPARSGRKGALSRTAAPAHPATPVAIAA